MGCVTSAGNQGKQSTTTNYERAESGAYPARCIQCIDLGTRDNEYQGEVKKRKELMITWELSELMQDGRPFVVSWRGTNTLNEKGKLFQILTSWRGKPFTTDELKKFELSNILDACCMINISKETSKAGKDFNKVISVMRLPKGMQAEPRVNELVDFGINDITNEELFGKLYPWVQNIVKDSDEYKALSFQPTSQPTNEPVYANDQEEAF